MPKRIPPFRLKQPLHDQKPAENGDPAARSGNFHSRISYGYHLIPIGFVILMIVWGSQYSYGVFFKPILAEFNWTRTITSSAFSVNLIVTGLFSIIAGRLCDRFGAKLIIILFGSFSGFSFLLMSQLHSTWQLFLFYGIFAGVGAAGVWIPILSSIARWFNRKRGMASGIIVAGVGVGTTFMPLLATQLIAVYSWRNAYLIMGLISLVIVNISAQFFRRNPEPINQPLPNINERNEEKPPSFKEGNSYLKLPDISFKHALRTVQLWKIAFLYFLLGICLYAVIVHIVPFASDIGYSAGVAASILSVVGLVSIFSKIMAGCILDRIGNKPTIFIVATLMLFSFIWIQLSGELWMIYFFAVLFALAYGGFVAVQSPLVAEVFGLRSHGLLFGFLVFITDLGGAIGAFLAGLIFDITASYQLNWVMCSGVSACGIIISILLMPGIQKYKRLNNKLG